MEFDDGIKSIDGARPDNGAIQLLVTMEDGSKTFMTNNVRRFSPCALLLASFILTDREEDGAAKIN